MPDRDDPPLVRTRDDLLFPIAGTIRLHLTYLSQQQAEAVADTVLRAFKAAGLAIRRKRNQNGRNDPAHGAPA